MVNCFNCGHFDAHRDWRERRDCGYKTWAYKRPCKGFFFKWPDHGEKVNVTCHGCGEDFEGEMRFMGNYPSQCPKCIQKRIALREKIGFDGQWKDCRWCNFSHRVNQYAGFCTLNFPAQEIETIGIVITRGIYKDNPFMIYEYSGYSSQCPYFSFSYQTLNDGLIAQQMKRERDDRQFKNVMESMGINPENGEPLHG